MEQIQDALYKSIITTKEWLQYYINTWTRNVIARTIDVETDKALVAQDPDMLVLAQNAQDGQQMKVIQRLEVRKASLSDAVAIMNEATYLIGLSDAELAAKWTPEALALDPALTPRQYKITKADGLTMPNGHSFVTGTILMLDPTDDEVKKLVEAKYIEEVQKTA